MFARPIGNTVDVKSFMMIMSCEPRVIYGHKEKLDAALTQCLRQR